MNDRIIRFVDNFFASSTLNRLPEQYGGGRIFDKPLIGVARGDDSIFGKFKEVVGPEHLTPTEMWIQSGLPDKVDIAKHLRIVSIIFPYVDRIREQSKTAEKIPEEIYSVGRNYANALMDEALKQTVQFFIDRGHNALAGMLSPAFQIIVKQEPVHIYSTWSERHMAFAAGLGTFSLHEGFISEVGCNIRVSSVITDAPLSITPRKSDEPYANCLFYSSGKCQKCAKRCPAAAISEDGHDKLKCYLYLKKVEDEMVSRLKPILKPHRRMIDGKEEISYPVGCAFCQFHVPCMDKNPANSK